MTIRRQSGGGGFITMLPRKLDCPRARAAAIRGLNMITQKLGGRPWSRIISIAPAGGRRAGGTTEALRSELELMLDLVML